MINLWKRLQVIKIPMKELLPKILAKCSFIAKITSSCIWILLLATILSTLSINPFIFIAIAYIIFILDNYYFNKEK
jgi:hypothetical protein